MPLAAIVATIPLLLWWCSVHEQTIKLKPVSFAEIEGWAVDDQAAAFRALVKSCRKRLPANSPCKEVLALGDNVDRDAARRQYAALKAAAGFEAQHLEARLSKM